MSIAESSKFPGYGEESSNGSAANSFTLSHSSSASSGFNSSHSGGGAAPGTSSRNSSFSQRNAPL